LKVYYSDMDAKPRSIPHWRKWLRETGNLPPDFDEMPTSAFPPDLLTFQNGERVDKAALWEKRKEEILHILREINIGEWPAPPDEVAVTFREGRDEEENYYIYYAQILFSPDAKAFAYAKKTPYGRFDSSRRDAAVLRVRLLVPKGSGPFPAFVNCHTGYHEPCIWDRFATRGYVVGHFSQDDAEKAAQVFIDARCNQLEWWAFAAGRVLDMLHTLPYVDGTKIAVGGHSRGGKTAVLAGIMNPGFTAVISSHPGTGSGSFCLWRYAGEKFGAETIEVSSRLFPYWNDPRMRFFSGRENKLPFDGHFLAALLAPRPLLMATGEHDMVGEPWGDQQSYLAVRAVYSLLGCEDRIGFHASSGGHALDPAIMDDYIRWTDMQFGRAPKSDRFNKLIYTYSFDAWKSLAGNELNISQFPEKSMDDILHRPGGGIIDSTEDWERKTHLIKENICRIIGELPPYVPVGTASPAGASKASPSAATPVLTLEPLPRSPHGFETAQLPLQGSLKAHITFPNPQERRLQTQMPVVIYCHAYLHATGYHWSRAYGWDISVGEMIARQGMVAVGFDMIGYGSRNREAGIEFFQKNPQTSILGVMIQDVRRLVDALSQLDFIDPSRMAVAGFSLGGMVALYAAAFDSRIKAVASTCGFASMRRDVHGKVTEGLRRYSHLHPTIPRLGLFIGEEARIPYDFHEILALIAPRPLFILAPRLDQDFLLEDVVICVEEAKKVYRLYTAEERLVLATPDDFNRYSLEYQEQVNLFLRKALEEGDEE